MSVLLKANIPQEVPFSPVAPATMPSDWTYAIPDSMAAGTPPADIAEFEFTTRPGASGALDVNLAVPAGRSNMTVAPYMEADAGETTQRWGFAQQVVTGTPAPMHFDFPAFPDGTHKARLGFELREPAAGTILRTNLFTDPRCTTTSKLFTRYSWTLSTQTAGADLPMQAGLRTYGQVQSTSSATGTGRGINLYQSTDGAAPTAGVGFNVSGLVGQTLTISGYVYSTKAGTVQASARCFSGTTWTAAAATGTAAAVTANTWTRYSVTITIPAGATLMCATFMTTSSVSWVSGDQFRLAAVLIEKASTVGTYFDGETADAAEVGYHWQGTANASVAEAYGIGVVTTVYRKNLCKNPSFETNTTGWIVNNATLTRITTDSHVGGACLKLTSDGQSKSLRAVTAEGFAGIPVVAGQDYTLSFWGKNPVTTEIYASIVFYDADGYLAEVPPSRTGSGEVTVNVWSKVSYTRTAPAEAAYAQLAITFEIDAAVAGRLAYLDEVLFEKASTVGSYFDGSYETEADYASRWTGTAHDSSSELYSSVSVPATEPGRVLLISGLTMGVQVTAGEVIGATLKRPLRRSVFDALNEEAPQIAVGTPGLLAGSITYLCATLEDALAIDSVYQQAGTVTLTTGDGVALDGFQHMAVEELDMTAERALPGVPSKWTLRAEVRELKESV